MRIALYGEGTRDVGRAPGTEPGGALRLEELGAAHVLVERLVVEVLKRERPMFIAPLLFRSRRARGSDLLKPSVLKKLLAWPAPGAAPDLAIVLVDGDGETGRYNELEARLQGRSRALPPAVVGVAVQEFEVWLIADHRAAQDALAKHYNAPPAPESMRPGQAKQLLEGLMTEAGLELAGRADKRREIARSADLSVLCKCSAFERLRRDLHGVLSQV